MYICIFNLSVSSFTALIHINLGPGIGHHPTTSAPSGIILITRVFRIIIVCSNHLKRWMVITIPLYILYRLFKFIFSQVDYASSGCPCIFINSRLVLLLYASPPPSSLSDVIKTCCFVDNQTFTSIRQWRSYNCLLFMYMCFLCCTFIVRLFIHSSHTSTPFYKRVQAWQPLII